MKSRLLVAAFGVPLTVILLTVLPSAGTAVFCAFISCVAVHEMFSAVGVQSLAAVVLGVVSALLITAAAYFGLSAKIILAWCACYCILLFALWTAYYERDRVFGFAGLCAGLMAGLIVPGGMAALVLTRVTEHGRFIVLLPIIVTFAGDGGALFAGMAFGKHKLAPKTSPKKTVEGAIGGLFAATLIAVLYTLVLRFGFRLEFSILRIVIAALVCSVVSQLGDLAFSLIKREFGVKDYGKLLPGHGGALDRFDSTVFAAPAMYIMLTALKLL